MFFFVAGVQPKTVKLEDRPRLCRTCGLHQARLVRIDHYLSLFFVPLLRVKKGEIVLRCERCGAMSRPGEVTARESPHADPRVCRSCGAPLESGFRYCPQCGKPVP
ncbi:MAG: zinc ribbon domain-containing protein [Deltaproteobacteria bacterium]|nr:zinc ribbon domain-containing protein [Deltaproteobacteria bacterium]